MLNAAEAPSSDLLRVIDYADPAIAARMAEGRMNTPDETILANIASSIRRGHTQMRGGPVRPERVCLVGSGPSLQDTADELRQLVWDGAILVTMNGAYHWCLERGLQPKTQIVMDARPSNARFVQPAVPQCRYVLASQCAPEVWDAVAGRPDVWIFHAVLKQESALSDVLDHYYAGQWVGIGGGTTVATRAISLLRTAGYVRFELFGIDCCWQGDRHHAVPQPENAHDRRSTFKVHPTGRPDLARSFVCSAWHVKQAEDFVQTLRVNGQHFLLHVHGDGLLAHILRTAAESSIETVMEDVGVDEAALVPRND